MIAIQELINEYERDLVAGKSDVTTGDGARPKVGTRSRRDADVPLGGRARWQIINNRHYSRDGAHKAFRHRGDGSARPFVENCEHFCASDIVRFSRHVAVTHALLYIDRL